MKRIALLSLLVVGTVGALIFSHQEKIPGEELGHLSIYSAKSGQNLEALKDALNTDDVSLSQSAMLNEDLVNKEILQLAEHLRVNDDETYRLRELNNFRTPLMDILSRVEPMGYTHFLQETMKKIVNCLPSDFCGMERDDEASPYFDEGNTTAHKTLVRALTALEILADRQEGIFAKLDVNMLERLLENKNSVVQQKAMALIKRSVSQDDAFDLLMTNEQHFQGEVKAIYYKELSGTINENKKRVQFESSLVRTLEYSDPNTVISVVESMSDLPIEAERLSEIVQNTCRFKTAVGQGHNWKAVRYEIEKMKNNQRILSNFECL